MYKKKKQALKKHRKNSGKKVRHLHYRWSHENIYHATWNNWCSVVLC